jgi:hypothetical protein
MRKDPLIIIFLVVAFAAFGFISFIIALKPNKRLIAYKLKLGGILLSLTVMVSCGNSHPTCYDVANVKDSVVINSNTLLGADTIAKNVRAKKRKINTRNQEMKDPVIPKERRSRSICYGKG